MTATKTFETIECKALGETDGKGSFEALVSVFGNIDRDGDRVMPGAFAKSLANWREKGRPVPVVWSHQRSDPFAIIGSADPYDIKETDVGLEMRAQLDMTNPHAAQVYNLMKSGLVGNFSYTYEVKDARRAKDATELLELDLIEAGPCLVGANAETALLSIKAADELDEKAGARINAATRERIAALERHVTAELRAIRGEDDDEKSIDEPADEMDVKTGDEPADEPAPLDARELTAKAIQAGLIDAERFTMKPT